MTAVIMRCFTPCLHFRLRCRHPAKTRFSCTRLPAGTRCGPGTSATSRSATRSPLPAEISRTSRKWCASAKKRTFGKPDTCQTQLIAVVSTLSSEVLTLLSNVSIHPSNAYHAQKKTKKNELPNCEQMLISEASNCTTYSNCVAPKAAC